MGDLLIVGIDPGTTLGYAILDINKKILDVNSSKELDFNNLIKKVNEFGKPLIIGTDKKKIPHFVSKFAAQFNARIVSPEEDLSINEKNYMTKEYSLNNHKRDALAAALYSYSRYDKLFSKIDHHLEKFDKEIIEKVRELCVKDELSIALSLDLITKPEKEEIKEIKKIIQKKPLKNDLIFLYDKIKEQEKSINFLIKKNKKLRNYIRKIKEKKNYLLKKINQSPDNALGLLSLKEKRILSLHKEIQVKNENINYLQSEMGKVYDFFSELGNSYLVKKLNNLGYEEFMKKNKLLKIKKNDILLVDNIDIINNRILEFLKDKIKIIIYKNGIKRIKEFILIKAGNLRINEDKYFALVNKDDLEKEKGNIDLLKDIIIDYKKSRLTSIHQKKQL